MTARSIGTATISFGLVSIPVKLFTTNETDGDIHFNMLHEADGARLKQQYVCTKCNEVVDKEHTVKGYEHAKGQYVILSAEELKALDAVATQTIAIEEFVPAGTVDPIYVEKTYYLGPDRGGERAYRLLRDAMVRTERVAVASYSARGKQHIVSLSPFNDGLVVHQLRYASEVKPWSEIPVPELAPPSGGELALATQIIGQFAADAWHPEKYRDEVQERMAELIQKKIDGQEITIAPEVPHGATLDLMAALKASIANANTKLVGAKLVGSDRLPVTADPPNGTGTGSSTGGSAATGGAVAENPSTLSKRRKRSKRIARVAKKRKRAA